MFKNNLLFLFVVCAIFSSCVKPSAPGGDQEKRLAELVEDAWQFRLREFPQFATYHGDASQNHRLESLTPEDMQRRKTFYAELIDQLDGLDADQFSATSLVDEELLRYFATQELAYYEQEEYRMPLNADEGFHTSLAQLVSYTPFHTVRDYENYLSRLHEFPGYFDQQIRWMRKGMKDGFTVPGVVLEGYEVTISGHVVHEPEYSVFYKPFQQMPAGFSDETREQLQALGKEAVLVSVVTEGYGKFLDFFVNEYRPACRQTIAAKDLPNGEAYYRNKVAHFTTTDLSVDEIHDLGLSEVARIEKEMEAEMAKAGFQGDRSDFIKYLRTDPRFYPKTAEELLMRASFIAKKMDGELPKLFGRLPRQPYGVAPVPRHLESKYTAGRYVPAPAEGTEPGYYWVNTYNLSSRALYNLEALTLHEAVPGHHLQIALTQELDTLSRFRQDLYVNAFGEGWGLYAEWLGIEAGFYQDPYTAFGRLTYEMWRACRLVVDTGIHAKGWTRQQVIDYLAAHTALSIHECTTETDRYISWPGQALAYKIGELKIKALRKMAEQQLGEEFDVREFHDVVLSQGTVTLPILEKMVVRYLEDKRQK